MKDKLDYIVIGQGIAGTTLAWWLNFNKKQFYILNDEKKKHFIYCCTRNL